MLKRDITLSSPVMIYNDLEYQIEVQIEDRKNTTKRELWQVRNIVISEH